MDRSRFRKLVPAAIAAAACAAMGTSVALAPFFLVPLGVYALRPGSTAAGTYAASAAAAAVAAVLAVLLAGATAPASALALVFAVAVLAFAWIAAPAKEGSQRRPRLCYRVLGASAAFSASLWPAWKLASSDPAFLPELQAAADSVVRLYADAAGADVVLKSTVQRHLTADLILEASAAIYSRGFAFLAAAAVFVFSWKFARFAAAFRRPDLRTPSTLKTFKVEPFMIWPYIGAFAVVLAGNVFGSEPLEILGWNALAAGTLLYGAQGWGVLRFNLERPSMPRFLSPAATLVIGLAVINKPEIFAFVALASAAVGVAENWLPLRATRNDGPPSTPEA